MKINIYSILKSIHQKIILSLRNNLKRSAATGILLKIQISLLCALSGMPVVFSQSELLMEKTNEFDWLQTARVFLMDAYQPPFVPELEYDANLVAETMLDMNANVLRFGTMGKYATIQGIQFSVHSEQGDRDLLQETIDACKPRGIKVVPYISTGHKLAWSMVTEDYPQYAQRTTPGGLPDRNHMYVGEDHGTVCWMGPYREAYLDYVEHVVKSYDIDGIYFDAWRPFYFWPGKKLCFCDGCRVGFKNVSGLEIPFHDNDKDYTSKELETINKYHAWYSEEFITTVVLPVREIVKSYKNIPLISNINNPGLMASQDVRILNSMDAFLYERGKTLLERAEGVSVPHSLDFHVWPYIGSYHHWPRLAFHGLNYQQQIFTNLMFGGGSIIAQPTGYLYQSDNKEYVSFPFEIIAKNESTFNGQKNHPYIGVVYAYDSPTDHVQNNWFSGRTDARNSTRGAFSVCLYNHIQVSSVSEFVLDNPEMLNKYPILYLANIPYLSNERIENIHDYVKNGGNLIVSYATALFDKDGKRQPRFGLEKLIKVRPLNPKGKLADEIESYQTDIGGPNDLYLMAKAINNRIFNEQLENKLFPLWYYEPVEILDGGEVLMDIVKGDDKKAILPGVVKSTFGQGQVVYCASALESLYDIEGPNLVEELVTILIEEVATTPPPYSLNAPASVIANLTSKENEMVLHLTNWTGNKFEKPWRNEYYLAPVENIHLQIRIPDGKKVKNTSILVKAEYDKKLVDGKLDVFFPRLDAYQAIVVEFE